MQQMSQDTADHDIQPIEVIAKQLVVDFRREYASVTQKRDKKDEEI